MQIKKLLKKLNNLLFHTYFLLEIDGKKYFAKHVFLNKKYAKKGSDLVPAVKCGGKFYCGFKK